MNKQIEEMAREICSICHAHTNCTNTSPCTMAYVEAEGLCENEEYRKQREGEWVLHKPRRENRNATYKCSVCGKLCSSYYNDVGEWNYCPKCGAKMKGGAK